MRETEHKQGGEGEGQADSPPNGKPDAGLNQDLSKSKTLNQLSHPDTPQYP